MTWLMWIVGGLLATWIVVNIVAMCRMRVSRQKYRKYVLELLETGPHSGRQIKREIGWPSNSPWFYGLMADMEDDGLIRGWWEKKDIDGETIRERWYSILPDGVWRAQNEL